ncbi:hypothetical protein MMC29_003962, partial [Sticta canariensis]|nr:hypothetical protein [Sticta canariensis]
MASWLFNTAEFKVWLEETGHTLWCIGMQSLTRLITVRKVKADLTTLPKGLENMYSDVLERIQVQDTELASLAMDILRWVYHAKRPLQLLKLWQALAVEPEATFLDEEGLLEKDVLVSVCGGLLSVQRDDTMTLIHYTAQEYFDRGAPLNFQDVRIGIARTCLTYLPFEDLAQGTSKTDEGFEARLSRYPFLAIHQALWGHHDSVAQLLLDQGADYNAEINSPDPSLHSATAMQGLPLHLASIKGNASFVKNLIGKKVEVDVRLNKHGWTGPLHMAAAAGHMSVTELLTSPGAEVDPMDGHGATATHRAAENGQ